MGLLLKWLFMLIEFQPSTLPLDSRPQSISPRQVIDLISSTSCGCCICATICQTDIELAVCNDYLQGPIHTATFSWKCFCCFGPHTTWLNCTFLKRVSERENLKPSFNVVKSLLCVVKTTTSSHLHYHLSRKTSSRLATQTTTIVATGVFFFNTGALVIVGKFTAIPHHLLSSATYIALHTWCFKIHH